MKDPFFAKSLLCLAFLSGFAAAGSPQEPPRWSYAGKDGPNTWGKLDSTYSECSTGPRAIADQHHSCEESGFAEFGV